MAPTLPNDPAGLAQALRRLMAHQTDRAAEAALRDLLWRRRHLIVTALESRAGAGEGGEGRSYQPNHP